MKIPRNWYNDLLAGAKEYALGEVRFTTCFALIYKFIRNNKKAPIVENKVCPPPPWLVKKALTGEEC